MTIYAWKHNIEGEIVTIIPAADSSPELKQWWDDHFEEGVAGDHYTTVRMTEPLEHLFDDDLRPFKKPVIIVSHADDSQRDTFIAEHILEEVKSRVAIDRQEDMVYADKLESDLEAEKADRRTIAELTGTDKDDPWDTVPSKGDKNVMAGAPAGITGHGAQSHGGAGKIKKTKEELQKEAEKEEDPSLVVRGIQVDDEGNINVDMTLLDDREKEIVREMRAKAKQEKLEREQKIREQAAEAGLDADKPETYTAIEDDGTIIQQDNRLRIIETVFKNGHRGFRDMDSGTSIDPDAVDRLRKKREAEAQIRDIEVEEAREKQEAEEAAKRAEEEKSELQKKLERMRRGDKPDSESKPVKAPVDLLEELVNQINQEIAKGFPAGNVQRKVDELEVLGKLYPDFASKLRQKIATGEIVKEVDALIDRKIDQLIYNANAIYGKLNPDAGVQTINTNRQKQKDQRRGDEFYYAALPPGALGTDENAALLGQEAFIVFMPKKEFDEGKLPQDTGGWFTEEELNKWAQKTGIDAEEISPSVYRMDCSIGDATRHFRQVGAAENGKLLLALGVDISNIPFDWPYHYHPDGQRVTDNEMRVQAVRVLQIARDKGIVLDDDAGTVKSTVSGVDMEKVAPTQQDITGELKKKFGASGKTDDEIAVIMRDAVIKAKKVLDESGLTLDQLQLSPEVKALLED